ncbi:guanine nucleotide-binding protein alpha-2 subunit [Purpureocillium lavendulum]|uniref:Guanine nucleotide-binding protein alpha-2 subunit n=1 Tax=Purpureocillium lavendulum TaxID=1247861 RepID=A0AB34FDV6_9HYPO|nr:guanine nucleotide-binding protein alpha-2 subunit [Purpureocillium lavendulum]
MLTTGNVGHEIRRVLSMCLGCGDKEDSDATRSRDIDRGIRQHEVKLAKEVKLLLLGPGESGKTTILKQMRLIYCRSFTDRERLWWKPVIFRNFVESFRIIQVIMSDFNYSFETSDSETHMTKLVLWRELGPDGKFPQDMAGPIKALWQDTGVKAAFSKGSEYALQDNMTYFISNISRIWADGYIPNDLDILSARLKTTNITECCFTLGPLTYRILDVGGQRSERKKWIHCFENVQCVLFMVAMSGYDQCLVEDMDTNQMSEALILFEYIVNSQWFTKSAMILFLNKMDLFKAKLPQRPITKHGFTDYRGAPADYKAAGNFFLEKFRAQARNPDAEIYGHFTTATDTDLVKITMESVQDMIIQRSLKHLML